MDLLTKCQATFARLYDMEPSDIPPDNPAVGQIWTDTSVSPPVTRQWDGEQWVLANSGEFDAVREETMRAYTEAVSTSESIMLEAVKEYVKITDFNEYKEETASKIEQQADEVAIQVSQAKTEVDDKYGDVKAFFEQLAMFYTFGLDGFTIGRSDSPFTQRHTDNVWELLMNGLAVMRADAEKGTFDLPNLIVSKMINVLGLVIEKDEETGIVNCCYGGDG